MDIESLLTLLLGGGALATFTALFKGVKALQTGARAREKDTVNDLVKQRKSAWRERDKMAKHLDYWRNWAGTVEYYARAAGVDLPPRPAFIEDEDDEEAEEAS